MTWLNLHDKMINMNLVECFSIVAKVEDDTTRYYLYAYTNEGCYEVSKSIDEDVVYSDLENIAEKITDIIDFI